MWIRTGLIEWIAEILSVNSIKLDGPEILVNTIKKQASLPIHTHNMKFYEFFFYIIFFSFSIFSQLPES